jgi:hypothetical protein
MNIETWSPGNNTSVTTPNLLDHVYATQDAPANPEIIENLLHCIYSTKSQDKLKLAWENLRKLDPHRFNEDLKTKLTRKEPFQLYIKFHPFKHLLTETLQLPLENRWMPHNLNYRNLVYLPSEIKEILHRLETEPPKDISSIQKENAPLLEKLREKSRKTKPHPERVAALQKLKLPTKIVEIPSERFSKQFLEKALHSPESQLYVYLPIINEKPTERIYTHLEAANANAFLYSELNVNPKKEEDQAILCLIKDNFKYSWKLAEFENWEGPNVKATWLITKHNFFHVIRELEFAKIETGIVVLLQTQTKQKRFFKTRAFDKNDATDMALTRYPDAKPKACFSAVELTELFYQLKELAKA